MKFKRKSLYLIIKKDEIKKIKDKSCIYFSLCPFLDENLGIKFEYPNPIESNKKSYAQVLESEKVINEIYKIINHSIPSENQILIQELIKPYLDTKISFYFYLKAIIPKFESYKLNIKNKWVIFNNISSLLIAIEKSLSQESGNFLNIFSKFTCRKYNFLQILLAKIQLLLINKITKRSDLYILSTNKSYFMPKVYSYLKQKNKNIIIYNPSQKLIKISTILTLQLFSIIFKNKKNSIEFFMIPALKSSKKIKLKYEKINIENKIIDEIYFNFLIKDLQKYINYSFGYKLYNFQLFNKNSTKQINSIFHTNRYPDLNTLSQNFSRLKIIQHLISHGTHTIQNDKKLGNIISDNLSVGMLTSRIPEIKIYSQTKFSDDYLSINDFYFEKIKPIHKLNKLIRKNNNSEFLNILSAGTVKQLGHRRHYFESSFEYIYGIFDLCNKIKRLNFKVQITLRLRYVNNEIDSKVINIIENKCKGILKISKNKFLEDDISSCDCLIALSSTTLEQAINYSIPSMSYGYSNYNHFCYYEKNNKYRINSKLKNYIKLKEIERILERKFIFLENNELIRKNSIYDFI